MDTNDLVLKSTNEYQELWYKTSRFDTSQITYIKHMLQHSLPEKLRKHILNELFRKYVNIDELDFSNYLYKNLNQLKEMFEAGITIGTHGSQYYRLSQLSEREQYRDIEVSLTLLDVLGIPRKSFHSAIHMVIITKQY